MIRRLDSEKDKECLIEAYSWDKSHPSWYRDMDEVWGPHTVEDFIELAKDSFNMFIGVFDDQRMIGLTLFAWNNGKLEAHIYCPRDVNQKLLIPNLLNLRNQLFADLKITEIYVWVAKKNIPTRKLCAIMGFHDTGLRIIKGTYHSRVIEWVNLSVPREVVAMSKVA